MRALRVSLALTTLCFSGVSAYSLAAPRLLRSLTGPRAPRLRACAAAPTFDGSETLDAASVLAQLKNHKVAWVYAVANADGETQYVGTSRDVGRSLNAHLMAVPELVRGVRIASFTRHDRTAMNALRKEWIQALEYIPEGNSGKDTVWTESVLTASGEAAVAAAAAPIASPEPAAARVTSPFKAGAAVAVPTTEFLELTPENVDLVLEEVRPYLISDGGNVAVAGVDLETRSVRLVLQGACGSCPSSTVTMKMGIERVLKEKFEALGEVLDVTQLSEAEGGVPGERNRQPLEPLMGDNMLLGAHPPETMSALEDACDSSTLGSRDPLVASPPYAGCAPRRAGLAKLTIDLVYEKLEGLMPAITGLGGSIRVVAAEEGVATLEFSGPPKIKFGIEMALMEQPLIDKVVFQEAK